MTSGRDILRWDHGVKRRHLVLGAAVLIGTTDLFLANWHGAVPPGLALGAMLSPFAILASLATASNAERKTVATWSGLSWIGFTILLLGARTVLVPHRSLAEFRTSHLVGLGLQTLAAVGLIICGMAIASILLSALWRRYNGGEKQGGTPEEMVLSEQEYEQFKPHPYDTCMLLPRSAGESDGCIRRTS